MADVDNAQRIAGWHVTPQNPDGFDKFRSAYGDLVPAIWFWTDRETAEKAGHLGDHIVEAELLVGNQKTVDYEDEPDDRNALGDVDEAIKEKFDTLLILNAYDGTICGDQLAVLNPANILRITGRHKNATRACEPEEPYEENHQENHEEHEDHPIRKSPQPA